MEARHWTLTSAKLFFKVAEVINLSSTFPDRLPRNSTRSRLYVSCSFAFAHIFLFYGCNSSRSGEAPRCARVFIEIIAGQINKIHPTRVWLSLYISLRCLARILWCTLESYVAFLLLRVFLFCSCSCSSVYTLLSSPSYPLFFFSFVFCCC